MKNDVNGNQLRTYRVEDIQAILGISRTAAYELVKSAPFRVVRIGNAIRVSRADFDWWLDHNECNPAKGGSSVGLNS